MQCPKDRMTDLNSSVLMGQLSVKCCPDCQGIWIPPEEYVAWQEKQPEVENLPALIDRVLETDSTPAPTDGMASLCPHCSCYLARVKVSTKTPFYVERCPNCKGIWCDRGEWEVLEKTGLHAILDRLFSTDWQALVRERELFAQERRATINKLGPDLAARIFELAEILEQHPNGDFGVAYLMRRFDK
ncbi:MAG: zf-TFIIB domain-containing protein [Leptolyngbyaceae cyanobacterium HOT.MB2.61]|nr:zf-TFIIB domain-containing protein [Leptolyngbyaceae cyanobacterium HOT.MB2.61]